MESKPRSFRPVAFFAVALSTVAVLISVVTIPMVFYYIQRAQSMMHVESDFCKAKTRVMWKQVVTVQTGESVGRIPRQTYGQAATPAPPATPATCENFLRFFSSKKIAKKRNGIEFWLRPKPGQKNLTGREFEFCFILLRVQE